MACLSCFIDLHEITGVIIFKHKCHFFNHFEVGSVCKEFERKEFFECSVFFANTTDQVFLIIIRVFQI